MNKIFTTISIAVICGLVVFTPVPYLGVLLGVTYVLILSYFTDGLGALGFRMPPIGFTKTALLALAMAMVIQLIAHFVLMPAIKSVTHESLKMPGFELIQNNFLTYTSYLIIGWLLGGLMEEVLFRGFLLTRIQTLIGGKVGEVVAVITTSVFFGFLHAYQGITGQILIGFMGLVLGGFFILNNKNIWLNVLMHGFINTISLTALYLGWHQS